MDDLARTQRALEQLDRLRASRNGHAGLAAAAGVDLSRAAYALLRRIDEHGAAPLGELLQRLVDDFREIQFRNPYRSGVRSSA